MTNVENAKANQAAGIPDNPELYITIGKLAEKIDGIPSLMSTFLTGLGGAGSVVALAVGIGLVFIPREFDHVSEEISKVDATLKMFQASEEKHFDALQEKMEAITPQAFGIDSIKADVLKLASVDSKAQESFRQAVMALDKNAPMLELLKAAKNGPHEVERVLSTFDGPTKDRAISQSIYLNAIAIDAAGDPNIGTAK